MDVRNNNTKDELILLHLKNIDEALKKVNDNLPEKKNEKSTLKWLAETLLVPISIALLSFFVANSSNEISIAQIVSSDKKAETDRRLGYLNIFLKEISDLSNPNKQINALQLLYHIEPDIGKLLADGVQKNPENSFDVRFAAAKVDASLSANNLRDKLKTFRLVVYCRTG